MGLLDAAWLTSTPVSLDVVSQWTIVALVSLAGVIGIYYCRGRLHVFVAALAVNGLMIAATPVYGGHYFIDIFAGAVLAVVAVALVVALDRPSLRRATAITAQEGAAPAQSRA